LLRPISRLERHRICWRWLPFLQVQSLDQLRSDHLWLSRSLRSRSRCKPPNKPPVSPSVPLKGLISSSDPNKKGAPIQGCSENPRQGARRTALGRRSLAGARSKHCFFCMSPKAQVGGFLESSNLTHARHELSAQPLCGHDHRHISELIALFDLECTAPWRSSVIENNALQHLRSTRSTRLAPRICN